MIGWCVITWIKTDDPFLTWSIQSAAAEQRENGLFANFAANFFITGSDDFYNRNNIYIFKNSQHRFLNLAEPISIDQLQNSLGRPVGRLVWRQALERTRPADVNLGPWWMKLIENYKHLLRGASRGTRLRQSDEFSMAVPSNAARQLFSFTFSSSAKAIS